ncbi:MAG: DUF3037 domain-containing protein [Chitinophagaceae bacterium]|nr:DUF3037 domain-containing protein [Chitinophagaceae bacterium]
MPGKLLYEYAVIRLVPRVEREEFLNLGIVFFCKQTGFLKCLYNVNEERIAAFCKEIDIAHLKSNLESFCKIAAANADAGPIAKLDTPSRFRWLTAIRSTILQTSRVHPGLCSNEAETLQGLYQKLVLY